ncbi:RND transporter [Alteromonas sp. KUL17]|uniref:efflux RND transporter periplasmic adaptor subunit n=1 Tax=Alteromonas sp. KUL17 TaxID=2480796 RepID=UPI001037A34F|nr:efflux RND transporter periplasmic adaptor subunit [Alteromonas sp. KUL17]TAP29219.1 efflux RND transporter periplasmic adaptor subunit [Alteromonas sp. KUL17]GEA02592.1 RND transporter [Alteromonas sp. KUL17]
MYKQVGWGLGIIFILSSPFTLKWFSAPPSIEVTVEPVVSRVIRDSVLSSGNLIYKDEAQLSPEIIARVKHIPVAEGDRVEEGQVLLFLDDQDIRETITLQRAQVEIDTANVERQNINVNNAQVLFDRVDKLISEGLVTQANFDDAYYELKAAQSDLLTSQLNLKRSQAALHQAEKRLRQTIIKAPMSGTVVAVSIKPGETAVPSATGIPGSSLMTVAKEESIVVDLNVDENDISSLSVHGEAYVNCPTLPYEGLKGAITDIAISPRNASGNFAANDTTGRSYSVKVKINDSDGFALRSGMSCRAKIYTTDPAPSLSVPVQAVLSDDVTDDDGVSLTQQASQAERYVFVASEGKAEKRVVVTGVADDQYLEIKRGLKENERVIIGPSRALNSIRNKVPIEEKESLEEYYASTH